jgi:hypothetical protein
VKDWWPLCEIRSDRFEMIVRRPHGAELLHLNGGSRSKWDAHNVLQGPLDRSHGQGRLPDNLLREFDRAGYCLPLSCDTLYEPHV